MSNKKRKILVLVTDIDPPPLKTKVRNVDNSLRVEVSYGFIIGLMLLLVTGTPFYVGGKTKQPGREAFLLFFGNN